MVTSGSTNLALQGVVANIVPLGAMWTSFTLNRPDQPDRRHVWHK